MGFLKIFRRLSGSIDGRVKLSRVLSFYGGYGFRNLFLSAFRVRIYVKKNPRNNRRNLLRGSKLMTLIKTRRNERCSETFFICDDLKLNRRYEVCASGAVLSYRRQRRVFRIFYSCAPLTN